MGVTLCTDRVESAFRSENRLHSFYHGHSYTGNALACAAANANLQIFDDEPVFDRIRGIAKIHAKRLTQLRDFHQVGDTRHLGGVGALELRVDDPGYLSGLRPKLYNFFSNAASCCVRSATSFTSFRLTLFRPTSFTGSTT